MREVKRILCPVDLSDESRHAIDHAIVLARWYKSTITAQYVLNPLVIPATDVALVGAGVPPILTEEDIKDASDQVAACFASTPGGHDRCTSGRAGGEWSAGEADSGTREVARCGLDRDRHAWPQRVPTPVDFSEFSLSALDFALSLARESGADLTILHAIEWPETLPTNRRVPTLEYRQAAELDVTTRLAQLVPEADRERCHPTTRLGEGKAYREILGTAAEQNADLVVMGVHGRNPLDLMLFGSTTNQVVRRATCPVLTLRR